MALFEQEYAYIVSYFTEDGKYEKVLFYSPSEAHQYSIYVRGVYNSIEIEKVKTPEQRKDLGITAS